MKQTALLRHDGDVCLFQVIRRCLLEWTHPLLMALGAYDAVLEGDLVCGHDCLRPKMRPKQIELTPPTASVPKPDATDGEVEGLTEDEMLCIRDRIAGLHYLYDTGKVTHPVLLRRAGVGRIVLYRMPWSSSYSSR